MQGQGLTDNGQFLVDWYSELVPDINGAKEYMHPTLVPQFAHMRGCSLEYAEQVFRVLKIHMVVCAATTKPVLLNADDDLAIMLSMFAMDRVRYLGFCRRFLGRIISASPSLH